MFELAWLEGQIALAEPRVRKVFRSYVKELQDANPEGFDEPRGVLEAAQRYGSGLQGLYLELAYNAAAKAGTVFDPVFWRTLRDLTDFQTVSASRMAEDQLQAIERARNESQNPKTRHAAMYQALGLTFAQVGYVEGYRRLVHGDEDTAESATYMATSYVAQSLATREGLVVGTEALRSVHLVGLQIIHQMADRGDIDANQVERVWRLTSDDSRPSHKTMEGQVRRGLIGTFTSGEGVELRFPADPRAPLRESMGCQCRAEIRLRS